MNRKGRLIILACVAFVLGFFVFKESFDLYHHVRELHRPNLETREISDMHVHSWMTPKEVASRYHVPVKQVFFALNIKPAPGDENMPLRSLKDKYHLSKEELQKALQSLIDPGGARKVDAHV